MAEQDSASAGTETPAGPLAGIRIVEFGGLGPVPFAGMLLADMGAEIVRIDRIGGSPFPSRAVDRGRRLVEVNLKDEAALAGVWPLLDHADALIEGFRPGVMERIGLGPEAALARNKRLVYGRMTGWGQTGPLAQTAGRDINYIAMTGALAAIGGRSGPPLPPLSLVGDYGGGALYLVMGLLAALLSARTTGTGQVIDCAMVDGAASLMTQFYEWHGEGRWSDRRGENLLDGGAPFYGAYECADGAFISLAAMEPRALAQFCAEFGIADAAQFEEPENWPALREQVRLAVQQRTCAQWCERLEGNEICFAPVLTMAEAPQHPHLAMRETFVTADGATRPNVAPRFASTPSRQRASTSEHSLDVIAREWSRRNNRIMGGNG
jgi:alpha-methylacyl-CoA racemase